MNATPELEDELKPEYAFDYTKAVRGKYFERTLREKGFVKLEPELLAAFPNDSELNAALRGLLDASRHIHLAH